MKLFVAHLDALYKALADTTRRRILELLSQRGAMSYTENMNEVGIKNTGKLNYHLKTLGNLVQKDEQVRYTLSEAGKHAVSLLKKFSQPLEPSKSVVSVVGGILLVIVGAFLVVLALSSFVALPTSVSSEMGSQAFTTLKLSPHATKLGPVIPARSNAFVSWSANASVTVYLLARPQAYNSNSVCRKALWDGGHAQRFSHKRNALCCCFLEHERVCECDHGLQNTKNPAKRKVRAFSAFSGFVWRARCCARRKAS